MTAQAAVYHIFGGFLALWRQKLSP